jgi:hypothetical protein
MFRTSQHSSSGAQLQFFTPIGFWFLVCLFRVTCIGVGPHRHCITVSDSAMAVINYSSAPDYGCRDVRNMLS